MKKFLVGFAVLLSTNFALMPVQAQFNSANSPETIQLATVKNQKSSKNHGYTILENKSVVIYKRPLPGNKQTGFKSIPEYYFSKGLNGEIKKLTIQNLKDVFRENDFLLDQIDIFFRSDAELIRYDTYRNTYKINYVLAKG